MSEDKNTEVERAAIEPEAIEGADELAAVEPAGTDIDLAAGDEEDEEDGAARADGDDVLLVKQYRYAFSRVLTEIPAGKREPGEDPFVTAQRELKEEIGAAAEAWTDLGALIASPGCYGETLYLFLACELTFGETHPDADEFLETVRVPFDEAVELCMSGELTDAKTVAAILKAKVLLGR